MNDCYIRSKNYDIWIVYCDNAIGPVKQFEGTYEQCKQYITDNNLNQVIPKDLLI